VAHMRLYWMLSTTEWTLTCERVGDRFFIQAFEGRGTPAA